MLFSITKHLVSLVSLFCIAFLPHAVFAQQPAPDLDPTTRHRGDALPLESSIDIDVRANGGPIDGLAMVSLIAITGQVLRQGATAGGHIQFRGVTASNYTIQVVAPGYKTVSEEIRGYNTGGSRITIDMQPASNGKTGAGSRQILLAPKAQKELGKALEALRAARPEQARSHLEAAYRKAPNHPSVNYLYGVYFLQIKNQETAKSYWAKALEFDPKNVSALLSMSEVLKLEQKLAEAETYVKRAVEAAPNSWRPHAVFADVLLKEGFAENAVKEADHALELGHGQAAIVQPLLARALAEDGRQERALRILEEYVQVHPNDAAARKQLEGMRFSGAMISKSEEEASVEVNPAKAAESAIALPLPSNWLPPDVDENVPPVEPGAACGLDEVLQNAGKRVEEFIRNVDRFAANEFLRHESVNKWGYADLPETRKFDYVVSIEQYRPGYFDVIEYRGTKYSPAEFPDGVETRGLPSMALIFHPSKVGSFAMNCEGLGQWNGTPAWQVHFRQRPDKPKTIRAYQIGENGPSYPVALRGRAWIAVDSYQILRIETDLVATLPEIRLLVDHTMVDYGPVRFKDRNVEMWLPQSAELYSDWRGKRMHRRHSFSNYILFSVDENQRISEPKTETKSQPEN
jgi:tetratricopeptide (TPR) repeat protein